MPYYAWKGITLGGTIQRGKLFAQSETHLDQLLFKREIALLSARQIPLWVIKTVPFNTRFLFFNTLRHLLQAGMRLPEALRVVSEQPSKTMAFQAAINSIADDIEHGKSINNAFETCSRWIDPITITMLHIGQESGSLPHALELITIRLQRMYESHKKIKLAALLPLITLIFFIGIAVLIFTVIIPSFTPFLITRQKELPTLTFFLLRISQALLNLRCISFFMGVVFFVGCLLYSLFRTAEGKKYGDFVILKMPLVGRLVRMNAYALFLESLSVLIEQGVHLAMALPLAKATIKNWYIYRELSFIEQDVMSGILLHKAMRAGDLFSAECCAMIAVGEESGKLGIMLEQASLMCRDQVHRSLSTIMVLFQPFLLLILGLLVAALIFALYIPLFQMPDVGV